MMTRATTDFLKIFSDWQECKPDQLDSDGGRIENSTLGYFVMSRGDACLTRGTHKLESKESLKKTDGPFVSAYYAAEWMAWNYWRLCYEPYPTSDSFAKTHDDENDTEQLVHWATRHNLSGIGNGYAWPNITISSDGLKVLIKSTRTKNNKGVFKYEGAKTLSVPLEELISAISSFVENTIDHLKDAKVRESSLHEIWKAVRDEIDDDYLHRYRRIEAMLGFDPDEGDVGLIKRHLSDIRKSDEETVQELASYNKGAGLHTENGNGGVAIDDLQDMARRYGRDSSQNDAFRLPPSSLPADQYGQIAAYRFGQKLAKATRRKEALNGSAVSSERLASMAAIPAKTLARDDDSPDVPMSFSIGEQQTGSEKVVFKHRMERDRRFAVARIIGDRLLDDEARLFHLVVDSATYRQKVQRAFAAELLSPENELKTMLGPNPKYDNIEKEHIGKLADHFNVSTSVIHNRIRDFGKQHSAEHAYF